MGQNTSAPLGENWYEETREELQSDEYDYDDEKDLLQEMADELKMDLSLRSVGVNFKRFALSPQTEEELDAIRKDLDFSQYLLHHGIALFKVRRAQVNIGATPDP